MQDCEGDDDNQDDSELLLVDDSDGDFNELAAETSSLGSSDSGGFVCSEDQRTFTAVRVRPMLPSEKKNGYRAVIDMTVTSDGLMTRIVNPTALPPPLRGHASARYTSSKLPFEELTSTTDLTNFPAQFTQEFRSDYTYWSYDRSPGHQVATQSTIYDELGVLALQTVLQGNNCSIFAYGQPSAGKTYSMMGNSGERASLPASVRTNGNVSGVRIPSALSVSERRGLIPRICQDLFAEIDEGKSSGSSYTAIMSYVEIYDERVYDLLSQATVKKPLKVREHPEDGAFVERARRVHVTSYSQVLGLIEEGHRTRSASSSHSTRSVRSHTVLFISLAQSSPADSAPRKSKLCMVDLAGSERVDRSDVSGLRVREAASVNRSLATLADVVGALAKRKSSRSIDGQKIFAPYRNSVLTRLLKDCLGGHAKTIMLGAISPCCAHYEESIATLRYIERARSVYSTVRIPDISGDMTLQLIDDASELKSSLSTLAQCSPLPSVNCGAPEHQDCLECNSGYQSPSNDQSTSLETDIQEMKAEFCDQDDDHELQKQAQTAELVLQRNAHLLNLVAIRRRSQALRKYRALNQWRTCASLHAIEELRMQPDKRKRELCGFGGQMHNDFSPQKSSGRKAGCPPLHNRTPTVEHRVVDRAQDVVAAVVAADAICCSVVQDFLFPDQPASAMLQRPSTTPSASLLELLASSSEFDRSGFRFDSNEEGNGCEHQLEELASPENWCSGDDEEVNLLTEFELTGMKEDSTILEDDSNVSPLLSLELCIGGNSMQSTLSLCVDSIDMARRALGPGVHNLRDNKGIAGGTGVECELLKYLDKKFIAMTRSLEDVMVTLQSCTQSPTCYELLESMVGEFCLQIIAKLCDQLPSAASACEAGRLQLETHLDQFSDRLRKLLPEVARDGDCMRSREANPAFVAAMELLVMTERIKLVWNFAGHRKRERLLHMHALEAAAIKDRKMTAKIAALEERNVELSARCKTLVATSGRLKEPSSNDFDLAHLKHTSRIQIHSTVTLEQLEKECGAAAALKSGDNLGAKLAVEVARARDVQARNDDMLCRFATLNRALAAASARVTALEAENSRLNCGLIRSIDSENSSGNSVAAMEALNDRTTILQKELDYAHKYARELESQLASLKRVNVEQIAELKSVQALLSREKEARKRVDADLHQVKTQSDALVVDLKHQLADAQVQANELIAAEWAEHEKRWQSTNASLVEAQETNAELSIELFKVKSDLRTALEEASQVEGESILHLVAIEELSASLKTQKETVEMCAEDAAAVQFAFKDFVSTQAAQISQLKRRICLDNQFQHELETKLAVAVQDRDEHILLLTQTEEALANALDREKMLRSQLEVSSAHDLEEINRVRAELHESTIEVASLREELTELLDHSTLQSATIDNMKLEHAEVLEKCQQLELERDEQVLQYRVAATHIEAVHQEHAETAPEQLSRMERQLEGERQDCMATLETLQRQAHLFHKSQAQQHSIKMNYCSTIRDLKAQVKIETRMLSEAVKQAEEVQNQKEVLVQQHEQVALKLADQLQECRIDLNASTQRWIRAETRGVLLRISMEHLNRYLIESHEVCMMHLADVESSRLVKDRTTPESEQAVKEQLSSLDAWFDEVISSNQTTTEVQSANNNLAHDKELDKARDEDSAARSSLLKTLTDLSALTNELLIVCDATPDVNTRSNTQSNEWKSLTEHHNNGVGTRCLPQEVPTQKTSTCSEVAQLRKIVMKLKEALDAKDDMLLFLDGKVKRLEQIASE
ncbi:hypothetical protein PR001_g13750 [Phytophthora rubi]|uniref:Kinesin motor domain-containing protein n=2 Tax=Phytophthora rubi TaxID=129364 RepID=A0A6A3LL60_9STRA|nr:hypothetical protein PR001_g13750 [Phytophthora rubi]